MKSPFRLFLVIVVLSLFIFSNVSATPQAANQTPTPTPTWTINQKDDLSHFFHRYGDIVHNIEILKSDFKENVYDFENRKVVVKVGNDINELTANSFLADTESLVPGALFTALNQDGIICFITQTKDFPKIPITSINYEQTLKRDYQRKMFKGYAQSTCSNDWLLVDDKGAGYHIESISQNGVYHNYQETNIQLQGYADIEGYTLFLTPTLKNKADEEQMVEIANQIIAVWGGSGSASGPINACRYLQWPHRFLLEKVPSNTQIEKWCGKMDFYDFNGVNSSSDWQTKTSFFTFSATPLTPPVGLATLVEGVSISNDCRTNSTGRELCEKDHVMVTFDKEKIKPEHWFGLKKNYQPKTWYLVELPKSGFKPDSDNLYQFPTRDSNTPPAGTVTYTLQ